MTTRTPHDPARLDAGGWVRLYGLAVAGWLLLACGAAAGPPKGGGDVTPPLPQTPEGAPAGGSVSVDLSKIADPQPFRRNLTPAQRIHTHLDLGRVFESQGNYEAALMQYQQGLAACEKKSFGRTHSEDEALAHRRIGNALDRLGRFAQSELHYKQAIKCSPRDPKIWNDAGYSYYLQGRWAEAERTFRAAERLAPDDPRIQTNLGLTLAAAGRTQEALPILSKFHGDAIGHANLGYLLAATGQVELARQQYLRALALRPNLTLAQRALAKLDQAAPAATVAAASRQPVQPVAAAGRPPVQPVAAAGRPPVQPAAAPPPAPATDPTVRRAGATGPRPAAPRHSLFRRSPR